MWDAASTLVRRAIRHGPASHVRPGPLGWRPLRLEVPMRAIVCRALQGPDSLELVDLPVPEPGACGVRIRVRAAGVNFADSLMLRGQYQEKPPLPFTPGLEVAGEIEAVGAGVAGLEPGRRVMAFLDRGGFAEAAVARAADVVPLPETMDDATAAGFAIAYGPAYRP